MKTVVFGINDLFIGGAQKLVVEQVNRIDRSKFNPVLITLHTEPGRESLYSQIAADVPVYRLKFSHWADILSWFRLYRLLRTIGPDVVLAHLFYSNTIFRILKPFIGYAVIACEHNTYIYKPAWHQILDRLLAQVSYRLVAVSRSVAEFTSKQEGIPKDKFIVIENGIDLVAISRALKQLPDKAAIKQELGLKEHDQLLLNVARLAPQKNHALLIDGFALFHKKYDQYRLAIVGGGPAFEVLMEKVQEYGLSFSVLLFGERRDVWRFFKAADLFVSTSTIEGFGIAHAEALAAGLPLLTTKTAGPDEMIEEGKNGFFITESTAEAVCVGLERLTNQDKEYMGQMARKSAHRYDINEVIAKYEKLIQEAA